jgi:hypothetical protein
MLREGRVVYVLSPTEVVVNLGSGDGIESYTSFLIYAVGDEMKDPDTGESLGRLEIVRGRGAARHVQEKITTVVSKEKRTERRDRVRPRAPTPLFASTIAQPYETVTEEVEVQAPFVGVQVGDLVRVI